MINNAEVTRRVLEWSGLSDEGLRLRLGEATAQELRTVKAVLNALIPKELADERTQKDE